MNREKQVLTCFCGKQPICVAFGEADPVFVGKVQELFSETPIFTANEHIPKFKFTLNLLKDPGKEKN